MSRPYFLTGALGCIGAWIVKAPEQSEQAGRVASVRRLSSAPSAGRPDTAP